MDEWSILIRRMNGTDLKVIPFTIWVIYFGHLIALVNDAGLIVWRDARYPLFLIDYLIANPTPSAEKVRMN